MSKWPLCEHKRPVCSECIKVTDAGRRLSDATKLICVTNSALERAHSFIAVKLEDGATDYTLYPSKTAAVAHQANEFRYAYLCLRNAPGGMSPKDATLWLELHRYMYDRGFRLTGEHTVIMPQGRDQKITRPI